MGISIAQHSGSLLHKLEQIREMHTEMSAPLLYNNCNTVLYGPRFCSTSKCLTSKQLSKQSGLKKGGQLSP